GDYPDLPVKYFFDKDPYAKYDDQQNRRNFNEPLHAEDDMYNMWSPDTFPTDSYSYAVKANLIFLSFCIVFFGGLTYISYEHKPAMPRNYPHGGLAKDLGAKDENDAHLYAAFIDR
ncbi:uncharacterized protein ASCRUDRAFT_24134, partial [Ascoidea rubescens DSM 1968]